MVFNLNSLFLFKVGLELVSFVLKLISLLKKRLNFVGFFSESSSESVADVDPFGSGGELSPPVLDIEFRGDLDAVWALSVLVMLMLSALA